MTSTVEIPREVVFPAGPIVRRAATSIEVGDGRTIIGRCVPYGVTVEVVDPVSGYEYRERILPGAFRRVSRSARRIPLNYEHRTDLGNEIGSSTALEDRDDGLYGTFRAYEGTIGDHALSIVRSGAATGLSIAAVVVPQGSRVVEGVVERKILGLEHVALTRTPVYEDASVLALRSEHAERRRPIVLVSTVDKNARLRARFPR